MPIEDIKRYIFYPLTYNSGITIGSEKIRTIIDKNLKRKRKIQ